MKVIAAVLFVVASVSARGSGPYLPSGWRPQGPAFYLPSELKPSSESPKEVILEGSEASGSDFLREYGPPVVQEISQNLISQGLPDIEVEQKFGGQVEINEAVGGQIEINEAVAQQAEVASEANVEQSSEAVTASIAYEEKSTVSEPLVEIVKVSEISQDAGEVEVSNVEILQPEDIVSSEGSTESVVNESSEANLLVIEESQSTPADDEISQVSQAEVSQVSEISQVSQVEAEQVSQLSQVEAEQVSQLSQVEAEQVSQVSQVEAEQVSQVSQIKAEQVSQVEEISEQVSQESANQEAVSQQEQKQEISESQSNEKSEVSQSESSQAVNEVGLVSAENIPDIIASIENEVKILKSEVSEAVSDVSLSGPLEQEPVGFLEYGPPGFAEYGPPKGAAEEEEKPALQSIEARRRRFSPKFRVTKKH